MTANIAILGGGHVGSLLGLALLAEGNDVTIFTHLSGANLRAGRILSSQCIWGTAAELEKRWAPAPWQDKYAGIGGFRVRLLEQGSAMPESEIQSRLTLSGNSVDQRMKVSIWLDTFVRRGGKLQLGEQSAQDLETISERFDLTIVCAGKFRGNVGDVFPRDTDRSRYDTVQRIGAVVFLHGRSQDLSTSDHAAFEEWTVIPGIGDFFAIPAVMEQGPCHIVCMEGFVGSPLDMFGRVKDPNEILQKTRGIFERWLPWEKGRWDNARLTDSGAAICGGFVPTVRNPVATLPNGRNVMAFGDAHILLDPLTAQGANTHIKNIPLLLSRIADASNQFTRDWMEETTEQIWQRVEPIEAVLEEYLNPSDHLWSVFRTAHATKNFGNWWVNSHFDRPIDLAPWITDATETKRFLEQADRQSAVR